MGGGEGLASGVVFTIRLLVIFSVRYIQVWCRINTKEEPDASTAFTATLATTPSLPFRYWITSVNVEIRLACFVDVNVVGAVPDDTHSIHVRPWRESELDPYKIRQILPLRPDRDRPPRCLHTLHRSTPTSHPGLQMPYRRIGFLPLPLVSRTGRQYR